MSERDEAHREMLESIASSEELFSQLRALGERWGHLTVALVASQLAGAERVAERLGVANDALSNGDMLTAAAALLGKTRRPDRGAAPDEHARHEPPTETRPLSEPSAEFA